MSAASRGCRAPTVRAAIRLPRNVSRPRHPQPASSGRVRGGPHENRPGIAPRHSLGCMITPSCGVRKDRRMSHIRWEPPRPTQANSWPTPKLTTAVLRGLLGRCPACGESHLFKGFLRPVDVCQRCSAPLGIVRSDDAPPYLTILLVGHIIVPAIVLIDRFGALPDWLMSAIFLPLTAALCLGLLRPVKGGTIGLMVTLNMLKQDPTEI